MSLPFLPGQVFDRKVFYYFGRDIVYHKNEEITVGDVLVLIIHEWISTLIPVQHCNFYIKFFEFCLNLAWKDQVPQIAVVWLQKWSS